MDDVTTTDRKALTDCPTSKLLSGSGGPNMPGGIGVGICLVGGGDVDAEKAYVVVVALLSVLLLIIIIKQHK